MSIDIVIPTFNQEAFTVKCLESIRLYTKNYRIIWVDNGSTLESREIVLKELKHHKKYESIWLQNNLGFVKAVNEGIVNCTADYVALQNNDTVVTQHWSERLIEALSSAKKVGVTGPLTNTEGSWQGWKNVKAKMLFDMNDLDSLNSKQISDYLNSKYAKKYIDVKMVAFFSSILKRETFDDVGLLDERFKVGFGDDDSFCHTLRENGYKVLFVPSAFVYHNHRTTFKSLYSDKQIQDMQNENMNLYKKKHNVK